MNKVEISASEVPLPDWVDAAKSFINKTLKKIERDNWDVSVLLCNDKYIKNLNLQYRHKDEPTDVLSFPQGFTINEDGEDRYICGDIVISLETLPKNAARFGISEDEELRRLLVHGLLHLNGLNHSVNDINSAALSAEPMLSLQENIISELSKEYIL
jgi:probable rRNA maturation factor